MPGEGTGEEEGEEADGAEVDEEEGEEVVRDLSGCLALEGCCLVVVAVASLALVATSLSAGVAVAGEGGAAAELATLAAHDDLDMVS